MSACKASIVLLIFCLLNVYGQADFTWSDCGVQLYKDIHYEVASISPETATPGKQLAINVVATISSRIINAQTRLVVWKDGEVFLDVFIDDLCDIISTTKALSCPLNVGEVSFTYTFDSVPSMPKGDYIVKLMSVQGNSGTSADEEIGCIQFVGHVDGEKDQDCVYTSDFTLRFKGDAFFTSQDIRNRKVGDVIEVGPGSLSSTHGYGTFVEDFEGTKDLGGEFSLANYLWSLQGTSVYHNASGASIVERYNGDFTVIWRPNATYSATAFTGEFNWTIDSQQGISGQMWLDPKYSVLDQFNWPIVIGNTGPFQITTLSDGTLSATGQKDWCTCGVDACGTCGGNGKSCGFGKPEDDDDWGARKIAAVVLGIVGFLLIILIADLSRRIRKARRRIPHDDTDLLDHPEKPDYGTMAIDDAIREGERVQI